MSRPETWIVSSFCNHNACVGVALREGSVAVCNTTTDGPPVLFTLPEWEAFIRGVKAGEFDCAALMG